MPTMYDRSLLRDVATTRGHNRPAIVARELGLGTMTAWRLWKGVGKPDATTAAAVQGAYGIPAAALLIPAAEQAT